MRLAAGSAPFARKVQNLELVKLLKTDPVL
jgi:hypothetical protein